MTDVVPLRRGAGGKRTASPRASGSAVTVLLGRDAAVLDRRRSAA
jgi:hypothetical protein